MYRPSFTARGVAHVRARLDRPAAPAGDPDVARALARDIGVPLPLQHNRLLVSYLRGRTRFFDDQVVAATGHPPCQVVIVGAGYDDRAERFRRPGVHFVEVDRGVTQDDKRSRLTRLGVDTSDVAFVAVDLEADSVAVALASVLDPSLPTMFVCEAVMPYLSRRRSEALLADLRSCPGTARRLVIDLPVMPRALPGRVALGVIRTATALVGERVRTVFGDDEVGPVLTAAGWREERRLGGHDVGMPLVAAETVLLIAGEAPPPRSSC